MPSLQHVTLGTGFIGYINSWVINDFENMPVGPCGTLYGQVSQGDASFGNAFFIVRSPQ